MDTNIRLYYRYDADLIQLWSSPGFQINLALRAAFAAQVRGVPFYIKVPDTPKEPVDPKRMIIIHLYIRTSGIDDDLLDMMQKVKPGMRGILCKNVLRRYLQSPFMSSFMVDPPQNNVPTSDIPEVDFTVEGIHILEQTNPALAEKLGLTRTHKRKCKIQNPEIFTKHFEQQPSITVPKAAVPIIPSTVPADNSTLPDSSDLHNETAEKKETMEQKKKEVKKEETSPENILDMFADLVF